MQMFQAQYGMMGAPMVASAAPVAATTPVVGAPMGYPSEGYPSAAYGVQPNMLPF
jgi:hypothetical protein